MESKYKVGSLQVAMLGGALLFASLALSAPGISGGLLFGLAALWLAGSALTLARSVRWPTGIPWQLLPSLLLFGLIATDAGHQSAWLWSFALLMMLPQPRWLVPLHGLLAAVSLWLMHPDLAPGQILMSGLLLLGLMALGIAQARGVKAARQRIGHRRRLVPGARLWSAHQLGEDLPREVLRSGREGSHAELVLLRTPRRHFWSLMHPLGQHLNDFEACYRLDTHTLATLMISRDLEQARQRRQTLLEGLPTPLRGRIVTLARPLTLASEYQALRDQRQSLVIIDEA
ncbi:hypothetical protein [Halomonas sp. YLGW01]|uniref:hypothetical protein n=1 Tax=Halomonas sp. YLGW01 TaxID=2773308 RepID=UPI00177E5671|nr:hypothetical protein [Halomonas sp. YLGW01]